MSIMIRRFLKLFDNPIPDAYLKRGSLLERNHEIINSFCEKIDYNTGQRYHYIDNLVRDCLNVLAESEDDSKLAPGHRYFSSWRSSAPQGYKDFADTIHQMFSQKYRQRQDEHFQKEKIQEDKIAQALYRKHSNLINKFFDIAYRKVTTVDQYGDENWKAFDKELMLIICKIAENEGCRPDVVKSIKKGYFWSAKGFDNLKKVIEKDFRAFYDKEKAAPVRINRIAELSGIDFENYLMNLFRASGYDVSGTPTTGDQGADIIAKKNGRKIAIQAKKHSNSVGNKAIQEVVGARTFYGCEEAWVITNSTFTRSALELAQKCDVKLIDGHALSRLDETI